jgi:hypothetical protein
MAAGVRVREKEGEPKKPTRYFSNRQEKQVAKRVGGTQTANSGATMWQKGDIINNDVSMLIECKTKMSPSQQISIKKEWLEKNSNEAVFMGKKHSALAFNFGPDEPNYYIIDEFLFQDLLDYLKCK